MSEQLVYPSGSAPPEIEEPGFEHYALLFCIDDEDNWRPVNGVFDAEINKTSLLVSRGHGKQTYRKLFNAEQSDLEIIKCESNQRIDVVSVYIAGDGTTGEALVKFAGGDLIFPLFFSKYNVSDVQVSHIEGLPGESVTFTTTGTGTDQVYVLVNYRIVIKKS